MEKPENKEKSKLEIAVESLTGTDAEKAYKDMGWAVNTFGLDVNGFLEFIKEKPKRVKVWTSICWYWVESLSRRYGKNEYDKRNEQSCYIGYQIQQFLSQKYEPLPKLERDAFVAVYIRGMAGDHRTNQQSFTSLIFAWLNYLAKEKGVPKAKYAVKRAQAECGERWFKLPMY